MMTDEFSSSGSPTPSVDGAGNTSRRQILSDSASTATSSSSAQTLLEQVAITQAPALTGSAAADENQESSGGGGGNVGGGAVPLPKSSSASSSSKPVPDVSSSAPPQGPVVVSNTQQNHAKHNAYSNHNYNHGHFNRQKSIKRTVGGGSIGFMRPPPPPPLPPPFPMFEIPYPRPVSNQFSYRNHRHDQDMPRDWNGPEGSMHMPRDWNGPRGSPHQMVPPHAGALPFFAPQPFGNPMGFGMPPYLCVPPQPMFMDRPPLTNLILNQIDYYFSETNLGTDKFLKENMDREGWVPIRLIAGFPRMDRLTKNIHSNREGQIKLILNSLRNSKVVEVQGEKLRPRKNWERWVATSANGARQGGPSNSSPVIEEVARQGGPSNSSPVIEEVASNSSRVIEEVARQGGPSNSSPVIGEVARQGGPSNSSPVIEDATTKPNNIVGLSEGSPSSETVGLSDAR